MIRSNTPLEAMQDIVSLDVPQAKEQRPNFLDITEQGHKENVISNVYRYFLDQAQSPLLSRLLLSSLEELIQEAYKKQRGQDKKISLNEVQVFREYGTKKGRIDLVIEDADQQSVVIVEAKVFFHLNNDLIDYWEAFDYSEEKKAGIVLSLEPISTAQMNSENFISITHSEWLNHARNKGLPHDLSIHDLIYFNDLVDNMNRLTHSNIMNKEIEFYLKHASKINQAIATRAEALKFVMNQFQELVDHFQWRLYGRTDQWRNLWDESNQATAYFTVFPTEVIEQLSSTRVILEINGKAMPHAKDLREKFGKQAEEMGLKAIAKGPGHVVHLYEKNYQFSPENITNLSEVLIQDFEKHLEPLRKDMMSWLKEKGADRTG